MPVARALARSNMAGRSRGGGDSSSSRPRFETEIGGVIAVLSSRVTRESCACMKSIAEVESKYRWRWCGASACPHDFLYNVSSFLSFCRSSLGDIVLNSDFGPDTLRSSRVGAQCKSKMGVETVSAQKGIKWFPLSTQRRNSLLLRREDTARPRRFHSLRSATYAMLGRSLAPDQRLKHAQCSSRTSSSLLRTEGQMRISPRLVPCRLYDVSLLAQTCYNACQCLLCLFQAARDQKPGPDLSCRGRPERQ